MLSIFPQIFLPASHPILMFSQKNCLLCGASTNQDLCSSCDTHLPRLPDNCCPVCLKSVPVAQQCGTCLTKPPAFTRTVAALRYAFPVDAMIHAMKYRANLAIIPILTDKLIQQVRTSDLPDLIIPMPLHPLRLRERGFNQALEMGRHLSRELNTPMLIDSCQRIKHTLPQAGLPWKARQKNILNAFDCKMNLSGQHIALIDDVMTTGATLNELAKVLKKQGAGEISNWVIARAWPNLDQINPYSRF